MDRQDNSPIGYTISFSLSKHGKLEKPYERKRHILVCEMAKEDLDYYRKVEKAAFNYVMAREEGNRNGQVEYEYLMKILGI